MEKRHIANTITVRLIMWMLVLSLILSGVIYYWWARNIVRLHTELFHNKMLITYEYTRRILSDVYVSVTDNVSYLERSLDHPEGHQDIETPYGFAAPLKATRPDGQSLSSKMMTEIRHSQHIKHLSATRQASLWQYSVPASRSTG